MTQISSTLLAPAPPPKRGGASPPDAPPDAPFASVLEDQARTAAAEGRPRRSAADGARRDDERSREAAGDGDRDPLTAAAPSPIVEDADAPALAALLGGLPLPAGVATADLAVPTVPGVTATAEAAPDAVAAIPTGPTVPAAATALPLGPAEAVQVVAQPALAQPTTSVDAPATVPGTAEPSTTPGVASTVERAAGTAPAKPAVLPEGAQTTSGQDGTGGAPAGAAPTPTVPPAVERATPQGAPTGTAAQQTAAPPAAPTQAAATTPATQPIAAPTHAAGRGVGLAEAVETVKLAFRAAAERGVTHARIALSPRELGGIEIHLKQTADGLVARVVAEHQAAAQLLHTAAADLRRSLEAQGLTLLQLDVGANGDERGAAGSGMSGFANGAAGDGRGAGANSGRRRAGAPAGDEHEELLAVGAPGADPTTIALPNGALVDVLA